MDDDLFLILVIGLFLLAFPIAAIAGAVMGYNARQRVRFLETRLAALESRLAAAPLQPPAAERTPPIPAPEQDREPVSPAEPRASEPEPIVSAVPAPPQPPAPPPPVEDPAGPAEPRAARAGLEERFGARWSVWIGALALGLGGVFLVRASIEAGLLGPGARLVLGALFAAALLAGGEWLRRRTTPVPAFASAYAPGALTAAGAATAFAVVWAAYALYGFVGPIVAFVALGVIVVATMAAAALHGPALAALGLVGALAVPILAGDGGGSAWPLPPYLAAVTAAAYGVARLRRWRWLALAAAIGAGAWTLLLLPASISGAPLLVHTALQTALAALAFVVLPYGRDRAPRPSLDAIASLVLAGFAALAVLVLLDDGVAPAARITFASVVAAILVATGLRHAPAALGALFGPVVIAAALVAWPLVSEIRDEPIRILPGGAAAPPWPEALGLFLSFAALAALAIAAAAGLRLLRGTDLPRRPAAILAAAASGTPLFLLAVVYWMLTGAFLRLDAAPTIPFATAAGLLAAAYASIAATLHARVDADGETPGRLLLAGTAAAALAALAAGFVFVLDRGLLTVALALSAAGSAWVADRTRISTLRAAVAVLGAVVVARLLDNPVVGEEPGQTLVFNWLLVGYGVPTLAFAAAARLLDRTRRDDVSRFAESLAYVFAAFLVFFQIRHAVHGGDPLAPALDHLEAGLVATAALAFATLTTRIDALRPDPVTRWGGLLFGAIALAVSGLGLGVVANPLFTGEPVAGTALFNTLLPAYFLPALLAGVLAWQARRRRPGWYVDAAGWLGLALVSGFVALSIRRAAQGPIIGLERAATEGEMWAYSAALILGGIAALAVGLTRDLRRARLVGLAFLAAAVVKVFLVDLANLEGVMRAVSFIALGLALVGLGLVYQRLAARGT